MLRTPATVRIRHARVADAGALTDVFRDSWQLAYRGIIPEETIGRIVRRRDSAWWSHALKSSDSVLVLEVDRKVAGYASYGPARMQRSKYGGEIYEIYLAPVYQGLGFGEHLFEACRAKLDERGMRGLVVWALLDNRMAGAFYWRRGGRPLTLAKESFGTVKLEKVAFGWP